MGEELRRQLRASPGVVLTETVASADVVLDVLEDAREQVVAASTAAGQVRELTLRARLRFKARTPAGRTLIAPAELTLTRDVSYSETSALAKEQEIALLFRSMHTDLAAQVLRRLAALTPG
jgi:LPS-assembly lipoprotein